MISQLGGAMMNKLIVVFSAVVLTVGCTHTQENGFQFVREQYVSKVQYNSIYHYGYNQGCDSALAKRGVADQEYEKDQTLDGTDTRFNDGWEDGNNGCSSGSIKTIYGVATSKLEL